MPNTARFALALMVASATVAPAPAQQVEERPALLVPLRPLTQQEAEHRESLNLYILGLLCEREDRLLEALSAFEKSAKLDPSAAAVHKAMVPLLLALERPADALATTRKVLELSPQDMHVWYLYARQLRAGGKTREACEALRQAAACPASKDLPEAAHQIHLDLGTIHETLNEPAEAIVAYARAAEILDHHAEHQIGPREEMLARVAETYERVGRLHLQMKQHARALDAFRAAQKKYPAGAARLSLSLARLCSEQGHPAEALTHLDAYLRLQPQGDDAYELKIELLEKLGRRGDALAWLRTAAEADRYNVRLKLLLARECGRAGKANEAERVYLELAELSPSAEVYRGLFTLYRTDPQLGMGRVIGRVDAVLTAAAAAAGSPGAAVNQGLAVAAALREDTELASEVVRHAGPLADRGVKLAPATLHLIAALAERARDDAVAERFYRLSLPGAGEAARPVHLGGLLRVLTRARKHADVVAVCREALRDEKSPNRIVYQSELARALARLEKYDEALREADAAVKAAGDSERLTVRLLRARVLLMAERHDQAEAECQALLKTYTAPGEVMEIRYLLSGVYNAAGKLDRAEEQLELCLKLDPENATLNNDLGYLWADRNKHLDRAEAMIRKALEGHRGTRKGPPGSEPTGDNAAFVDSLGWVLYRKGDLAGARRELERAAALPDGDDPTIWDHLGEVYRRLNLNEEARRAWQRAAHFYERRPRGTMSPRYREVREKLRQLESQAPPR